jgi:Cation transporting ATPase, C-terminus
LHHTVIFNTFVFLQVFNLFNCRITHDEDWNILAGFSNSFVGQIVVAIIVVMQIIIVEYGGSITQTEQLTSSQWILCVAFGSLSIVVGYFIKVFAYAQVEMAKIFPKTFSIPKEKLYAESSSTKQALQNIETLHVEARSVQSSGRYSPVPGPVTPLSGMAAAKSKRRSPAQ